MEGARGGVGRISLLMKEKGLARLGDAFVNLIYSSAKTKVMGAPFGEKVPDRVLSMALEISKIPVPHRLNHGERGDIVEALLAYAWTNRMLDVDEAVEVLRAGIPQECFDRRSWEREAMARAFSALIRLALQRIEGGEGQGGEGANY